MFVVDLIHEIGHAIRISHSDVQVLAVFAYYNGKIEVSNDDVLGIENLYGKPINSTLTPPLQPPKKVDE